MDGMQQLIAIIAIALIIFANIMFKLWLGYKLEQKRMPYQEKAAELHNERLRLEIEERKLWGPPPKKK